LIEETFGMPSENTAYLRGKEVMSIVVKEMNFQDASWILLAQDLTI
jgi:hypothetical protein